jgi:Spy/CpxP family protein refolding chaperone
MKLSNMLPTLALAATLALAGAARAGGPHGFGHHGPEGGFLEHHAEVLGLDDDTRERIRTIVEESQQEADLIYAQKREARDALHELLEADEPDRGAVMAQVERLGALDTEKHKLRIDTMMRIRAELTPEQRERMKEMRDAFRERHAGAMLDACEDDAASLCDEAGPFPVRCLLEHRDDLSEGCAAALEDMPRHHGDHHGRCGGHGKHGPPGPWDGPEGGF